MHLLDAGQRAFDEDVVRLEVAQQVVPQHLREGICIELMSSDRKVEGSK